MSIDRWRSEEAVVNQYRGVFKKRRDALNANADRLLEKKNEDPLFSLEKAGMADYADNYTKYRGKCREMSEALVVQDPSLRLVRGHYYEPMWDRDEPHWWCVKPNGEIVDPTRLQFPSGGIATFYTEFDGNCECAECGKQFKEEDGRFDSNYAFCSSKCNMRFVGL